MKEYHKIDTIFKRENEKPHKLLVGEYRDSTVEALKDTNWIFTEKVDGTNIRIHWDGHGVIFAGRTDKAQIPTSLLKHLEETFGGSIGEQIFEEHFEAAEVTLYGEGYGPKIQSGGDYRSDVGFILFDVRIGHIWLERDSVETIASYFDIPIVPIVHEGTISEALRIVKDGFSSLVAEGRRDAEGLIGIPSSNVLDRRGHRVIVKLKTEDFD